MALYCMGVMCSNPGGGTSQYLFTLIFFFSRCGERLSMETERSTMTVFENIHAFVKLSVNVLKDLNLPNFYLRLCLRSLLSPWRSRLPPLLSLSWSRLLLFLSWSLLRLLEPLCRWCLFSLSLSAAQHKTFNMFIQTAICLLMLI